LTDGLRARGEIRAGAWQESLQLFCDPAVEGEARIRCWKFAGATAMANGLPRELLLYLPSPVDRDWILFTRTFPRIAKMIQQPKEIL
jgi:hypothetical protein